MSRGSSACLRDGGLKLCSAVRQLLAELELARAHVRHLRDSQDFAAR